MTPVSILITIVAYFIILFTVSYIAGRKADNEGFFVGNRKSAWYVVAFAMIGSSISGVTFVSVPGMVAASGFSYLQMVLGFVAGQIIIAFVLIPLFSRMNLVVSGEPVRSVFLQDRCMVLFHLKNVRSSRAVIPCLPYTTTVGIRAFPPAVYS